MNALKRIGMVGMASFFWVLSIKGLGAEPIRTLTFSDVISLVTTQNLTLKQSAQQVALSEADVTVARAASHPDLNLSLSPTQNFNRTLDQTTYQTENQQQASIRASASSSITLYDGGANRAAYQAASHNLLSSNETWSDTRQRVIYTAASQFLQVSQDVELIRVAKENLVAQQEQFKRIEAFFEEGVRSRADVLQQQSAVAQAELQVLTAERNWTVDQLQLKQTLGLDPTEAIAVLPLKDTSDAPMPNNNVDDAIAARADVAAQEQQLMVAELGIQEAKAGYKPTLSLSGNLGTDYSSSNNLSGFQDQMFSVNPSFSVGLTLSFPIFDRSRTESNVKRAQVQLTQQELTMAQLKQAVAFEVELASADYHSAMKQREVRESTEEAAREALAAMEARYNTGAATLAELSQVRATYVDAASGLVEARYETMIRYLDMARTIGRIELAVNTLTGGI